MSEMIEWIYIRLLTINLEFVNDGLRNINNAPSGTAVEN